MINGLVLTIPGQELIDLLDRRAAYHRRKAEWWQRESERDASEQTEENPVLPTHMCENEAERHEWRAEVLAFMRERIEPAEIYRLGERDLAFGELLPAAPWCVEQAEYEERNGIAFNLEQLTKRLGRLALATN